ncbi:hypothetical protein [Streptomyces tendae]|uniref:hypothetical protein n=1 Tax=Streptomyces tendae TaxID=1932 RepID=UPI003700A634
MCGQHWSDAPVSHAGQTGDVVYAWGSAEDKNLALTGQTVSSRESTPHTVHPGGSGAAAVPDSSDQWAVWAAAPERSR